MAAIPANIVYGGSLMAFISSGTTKLPLAFSNNASLSLSMDTRETSSKDSGKFKTHKANRMGYEVSTDGLLAFDVTGDTNGLEDLYKLYIAQDEVNFVFGVTSGTTPAYTVDATSPSFTGTVIITSMTLKAPDEDNASYSVSMLGTGDLVLVE